MKGGQATSAASPIERASISSVTTPLCKRFLPFLVAKIVIVGGGGEVGGGSEGKKGGGRREVEMMTERRSRRSLFII